MKTLAFLIQSTWADLPEPASLLIFGVSLIVVASMFHRWMGKGKVQR